VFCPGNLTVSPPELSRNKDVELISGLRKQERFIGKGKRRKGAAHAEDRPGAVPIRGQARNKDKTLGTPNSKHWVKWEKNGRREGVKV